MSTHKEQLPYVCTINVHVHALTLCPVPVSAAVVVSGCDTCRVITPIKVTVIVLDVNTYWHSDGREHIGYTLVQ